MELNSIKSILYFCTFKYHALLCKDVLAKKKSVNLR